MQRSTKVAYLVMQTPITKANLFPTHVGRLIIIQFY